MWKIKEIMCTDYEDKGFVETFRSESMNITE